MRILSSRILQALGHWIGKADLALQVAIEGLDVAGFVEGLRRRIQLGVETRRTGRELRCHQQGALFAVQELGQRPGEVVADEFELVFSAEFVEWPIAGPRIAFNELIGGVCRDWPRIAVVGRLPPIDRGAGVPIQFLTKFIQTFDTVIRDTVVPVVGAVERGVE